MTIRHLATALVATLLWGIPASAQSAADLLQKGIYAQETLGDLDGAIRSYRQVLTSYPANKQIAAQAQYQLVVCMMKKGDRQAAAGELDALARNYPDQAQLIGEARRLVPAGSTLLPTPWPAGESSQLSIKRAGAFTGEYLYYSVNPNPHSDQPIVPLVNTGPSMFGAPRPPTPEQVTLNWKLVTKHSTRSVAVVVESDTLQPVDKPQLSSDDDSGDATANVYAGPAIDLDPLVYRLRRLPLAIGYKTTLTTRPFLLGAAPRQVELSVTATETLQVTAGRFNCYKVTMGGLGQTFWIGADGARPLVKIQFAGAEAELVKAWDGTFFDSALAFLKTAGWSIAGDRVRSTAPKAQMWKDISLHVQMEEIYTPVAEIPQALTDDLASLVKEISDNSRNSDWYVRRQTEQPRRIDGGLVLIVIVDYVTHSMSDGMPVAQKVHDYIALVRTEGAAIEFRTYNRSLGDIAVLRFLFEPLLATAKIP